MSAKRHWTFVFVLAGRSYNIPTLRQGASLVESLQTLAIERVVLEATGGLEMPAALSLNQAGIAVAIVNPRQVRDFAKATGKLAKTDTIDAAILAHFAAAIQPEVTDP